MVGEFGVWGELGFWVFACFFSYFSVANGILVLSSRCPPDGASALGARLGAAFARPPFRAGTARDTFGGRILKGW